MTTPIRRALAASSRLHALTKDGLQPLKRTDRALIAEEIRDSFTDSLDVDEAFRPTNPEENRWDYLLGHDESREIVALEPHSAHNSQVGTVIRKREASRRHLRDHLKPGVVVAAWFWVASGKVDFTPMDKAITQLTENGIAFVGKQVLRKWLPAATQAGAPTNRGRRNRRR